MKSFGGKAAAALLVALCFLMESSGAQASSGSLDPSFSRDGVSVVRTGTYSSGTTVVRQRDGKILAAGTVVIEHGSDLTKSEFRFVVVRLLPNGALDRSFGSGGRVSTSALMFGEGLATDSAGRILIVGDVRQANMFVEEGWMPRLAVLRLLPNGRVDETFGISGIAALPQAPDNGFSRGYDVTVQPDDKVVAAGFRGRCRGALVGGPCWAELIVARFTTDGLPDASFGAGGVASVRDFTTPTTPEEGWGTSILMGPLGALYVAGDIGGDFAVARLSPEGTPAVGWGVNGFARTHLTGSPRIESLALQRDGKLVAAGGARADCIYCVPRDAVLVRYMPDGTPDTGFGKRGAVVIRTDGGAQAVAVQADGRVLLATGGNTLRRFTTRGTVDRTFGTHGALKWPGDCQPADIIVAPDRKILITGSHDIDLAVVRLLP